MLEATFVDTLEVETLVLAAVELCGEAVEVEDDRDADDEVARLFEALLDVVLTLVLELFKADAWDVEDAVDF